MENNVKTQEEMLAYLKAHDVALLATIKQDNTAFASTVFYHVEDDCTFYFLTKDHTLKFSDIKDNHSAALAITDEKTLQTVQMQGQAQEADYGSEPYKSIVKKFVDELEAHGRKWEDTPFSHVNNGYYAFVKITPTWIRWSDYKDWGHVVQFEKKF